MANLRTYENKLIDYLTRKIDNTTNASALIRKYNSIHFSMNFNKFSRPHIVISLGISEAAFEIDSGVILSGSLGKETNEVRGWINKHLNKSELKSIWHIEYKKFLVQKEKTKKDNDNEEDSDNSGRFFFNNL